jgi:broad specificity phosphatase PhoE
VKNEAGLASGPFDAELSPLREFPAVYGSDLQRSFRTAEIAFPGARIIRDARLRVCDFIE